MLEYPVGCLIVALFWASLKVKRRDVRCMCLTFSVAVLLCSLVLEVTEQQYGAARESLAAPIRTLSGTLLRVPLSSFRAPLPLPLPSPSPSLPLPPIPTASVVPVAVPPQHLLLLTTPTPTKANASNMTAHPSPLGGHCKRRECSRRMSLACLLEGKHWHAAWLPEGHTLKRMARDDTVFISLFRHEPGLMHMDEMWYNMLYHFSRVVKGGSLLLGMSACPMPSMLNVTGVKLYDPIEGDGLKRGGVLPQGTVVCQAVPHPCDCPQKELHARCKFALILAVLSRGHKAFWMDSDTALLRDPFALPFPPMADILGCYEQNYHLNLGMLHIKSSKKVTKGFERAFYSLDAEKALKEYAKRQSRSMDPWVFEQAVVAQQFELHGLHNQVLGEQSIQCVSSATKRHKKN